MPRFVAASHVRQIKTLADAFKARGFRFAIERFGGGRDPKGLLEAMPIDFIKIDGRFICDIHRSQESFIVAKTITNFAHSIGAKAVAEFVHSPEVQWKVTEIRADYSQGYLIHKPAAEVWMQ